MRSAAWYAKFPSDAYAIGPFRFEKPVTEREARAYVRRWDKLTRLPRGTQVWPTK